jgi:hypothetical protein
MLLPLRNGRNFLYFGAAEIACRAKVSSIYWRTAKTIPLYVSLNSDATQVVPTSNFVPFKKWKNILGSIIQSVTQGFLPDFDDQRFQLPSRLDWSGPQHPSETHSINTTPGQPFATYCQSHSDQGLNLSGWLSSFLWR